MTRGRPGRAPGVHERSRESVIWASHAFPVDLMPPLKESLRGIFRAIVKRALSVELWWALLAVIGVLAAVQLIAALVIPWVVTITAQKADAFFESSLAVTAGLLVAMLFAADAILRAPPDVSPDLNPSQRRTYWGLVLIVGVGAISLGLFSAVIGLVVGVFPAAFIDGILAAWTLAILILVAGIASITIRRPKPPKDN